MTKDSTVNPDWVTLQGSFTGHSHMILQNHIWVGGDANAYGVLVLQNQNIDLLNTKGHGAVENF